MALFVYDHYLTSGQSATAQDCAARAFTPDLQRQLTSPQAQEPVDKGQALLSAYRAAGVDYVNFHWYIADTRALEEAVAYLRAQTGLPGLLVGAIKAGDEQAAAVDGLLHAPGVTVVPLSRPIAREAASLRARAGLGLADAIVAATALAAGCTALVGNDRAFGRLHGRLTYVHLDDVVPG